MPGNERTWDPNLKASRQCPNQQRARAIPLCHIGTGHIRLFYRCLTPFGRASRENYEKDKVKGGSLEIASTSRGRCETGRGFAICSC